MLIFYFYSILSCKQFVVGSNGTLSVEYSLGGQAKVIVPSTLLQNSGLCGAEIEAGSMPKGQLASGASPSSTFSSSVLLIAITFLGLVGSSLV